MADVLRRAIGLAPFVAPFRLGADKRLDRHESGIVLALG
jgi:hypothetical protein